MSDTKNPLAFPRLRTRSTSDNGMTLRDYFAGQYLASIAVTNANNDVVFYDNIAKDCYKVADAMLRERLKNNK